MIFFTTLKNQRWWIKLFFILAIAFIWIARETFLKGKLDLTVSILSTVGVLLIWIVVILIQMFNAVRSATMLENTITSAGAFHNVKPGKEQEIEEFQNELKETIKEIKVLGGRGFFGRRTALYSMPWYMLVGPPAAGKTTAVKNSGLDFPRRNEPYRGVGGTRNCDWFFSTKAIFLDTAGRYMTESDDQDEWSAFLETLRKGRPSKPVDGVILSISITDLLSASEIEIEDHAREMRKKLEELLDQFRVQFPVYLMFTKCDLMRGFVDYFGELSLRERDQIWGCTFTRGQLDVTDPRAAFEQGYDELHDNLMSLRRERLSKPLKRDERRKVYLFPLQFGTAKENLALFIEKLFYLDPYKRNKRKDNPIWRGFYFTSGTQGEGAMLDRAIKSIEEQFGLPPVEDDPFESGSMTTKHYFIKDLLTRVVIPDQSFSGKKTRKGKYLHWLTRGAVTVTSLLALVLFGWVVKTDQDDSERRLNALQAAADTVKTVKWSLSASNNSNGASNADSTLTNFGLMNAFSEQIDSMKAFDPTLPWTMFEKDTVVSNATRLYFKTAEEVVDKILYRELENRLAAYVKRRQPRLEYQKIYDDLKAYFIMGNDHNDLILENGVLKDEHQKFMIKKCSEILETRLLVNVDSLRRGEVRKMLERQIPFIVKNLKRPGAKRYQNELQFVERNRDWLNEEPLTINSVYRDIRQRGLSQRKLGGFSITSVGGEGMLKSGFVPGMFTLKGWEEFAAAEIDSASRRPDKADWVRGVTTEQLSEIMRDQDRMGQELLRFYYNEYIQRWRDFLGSIEYEPFGNTKTAAERMKILTDSENSPIVKLFEKVAIETNFDDQLKKKAQGYSKKLQNALNFFGWNADTEINSHIVDKSFISLHKFYGKDGDGASPFDRAFEQLFALNAALESRVDETGKSARDYAGDIIAQRNQGELAGLQREIRSALSTVDAATRQNIRRIFEEPISLAWIGILNDTQGYLNAQWQELVLKEFNQKLAKAFPFKNTKTNASRDDFQTFFDLNGGTVWKFFDEELVSFINKTNFSSKGWDKRGVGLSRNMARTLRKCQDIARSMFSGGSFGMSYRLRPQTPVITVQGGSRPFVEQYSLRIDGRQENYTMGSRPWISLDWPARDQSPEAVLRISVRGESVPDNFSYTGDWAIFRLVQRGQTLSAAGRDMKLFWQFEKQNRYKIHVIYDLEAASSNNPFTFSYFTSFSLPKKLN